MLRYVSLCCLLISLISKINGLWDQDMNCPLICTCRLEHLTETAIYRFMQNNKEKPTPEVGSVENNDVLYEESLDTIEILEEHGSATIIRSAICILQTETDPLALLETLPTNIESVTLIQGYESGNKSVNLSYLKKFPQLVTLELVGPNLLNKPLNSHLICEIDAALPDLKYLNLERILIRNSKQQIIQFMKEVNEEDFTFEYVKKVDSSHALTFVQKGTNDEEIVPYEVFKQQREANGVPPLFIGFKKLLLLRLTSCDLNNINWEMFDGLGELQYLILEKNNLRFIPPFAFYGTPNLKTLSLAHNKLLDIQITDLAGLLQLEYLDLSSNNFTQLSELSLPPFPKLKLANFANNPIGVIFPNTFEVMNTTNSLIIGSDDMPLTLITNSLEGLSQLHKLTLNNLELKMLKRDLFSGMSNLMELILTGHITEIEYDAFLEVNKLEKLILTKCHIRNISMDGFLGLQHLKYLDLSKNELEYVPPGTFDHLSSIKELYLSGNKFKQLPSGIFYKIHPKLLRLNDNPWHCSCEMSDWKPMIVNKIKQRVVNSCDFAHDKGVSCTLDNRFTFKYIYENKVAPKCSEPKQFVNWNVFHAMRKILKCPDYKPKLRKHSKNTTESLGNVFETVSFQNLSKLDKLNYKLRKHGPLEENVIPENDQITMRGNEIDNNINNFENFEMNMHNIETKPVKRRRKLKKGYRRLRQKQNLLSNAI
ncbi:hypothetical protein JTB14_016095 [Gonioctena quinquepunctata]|nr:hypothetical protein JTB14_016095 [Gonioctena quinquepunctata]